MFLHQGSTALISLIQTILQGSQLHIMTNVDAPTCMIVTIHTEKTMTPGKPSNPMYMMCRSGR